jgi:hypothetical protein
MASRKEEKERLRAQRLAAEHAATGSEKRRLYIGYAIAGLLAAAVLAGLVIVIGSSGNSSGGANGFDACSDGHFQLAAGTPPPGAKPDCRVGTTPPAIKIGNLAASAKAAGCELHLNLPDEGNSHIQASDPEPNYKTNPATSGNHITAPLQAPDGAYSTPIDQRYTVHSMEHGRVEYQYKADLPQADQLAIKGVFDEDPDGTLMFPNDSNMPYAVAVTAWTQMIGCPKYTPAVLDVLRNFRDTYRGNGPEQQVPISLQ